MRICTYRNLMFLILLTINRLAFAQLDSQRISAACQTSMQQLFLMCGNQQTGFLAGANCNEAMSNVDRICYDARTPQLSCAAAQKESELWCGGNSMFVGFMAGMKCNEARRKVQGNCFR